jgi:hypothetical protein
VGYADSESWSKARTKADGAEFLMAELWQCYGFHAAITVGPSPSDLLISATSEVKYDVAAESTGNLAIEVAFKDQPSGIVTSPSDFWETVLPDSTAIRSTTKAMRAYVEKFSANRKRGGDGGKSELVLVPIAALREDARFEFLNLRWLRSPAARG